MLGPQKPGECLPLNAPLIVAGAGLVLALIELVGLRPALVDDGFDIGKRRQCEAAGFRQEPEPQHDRAAGRYGREGVMQRRLGADRLGIDAILLADQPAMERILDIGLAAAIAGAVDALHIGFVEGEQQLAAGGP